MSKSYKSAMDGIKMSDELKKKIVSASAKGEKKRKLLRPVYISAASGLAACLALVFALHYAYVTHVNDSAQPELKMAQASELPQGDTTEYGASEAVLAKPEPAAEVNEKTAVAKADTEKKSAEKNNNNAAANDNKTAGSIGTKTDSEAKPQPNSEKNKDTEPELRAKAQTEAEEGVPEDAQLETASTAEQDASTTDEEIVVAKSVAESVPEPVTEDAAEPPVGSVRSDGGTMSAARGGGSAAVSAVDGFAASAQMPPPTEEPTEEAE